MGFSHVNGDERMPMSDDIAFLDATAQAELVKRKEVKPCELVEAAIERFCAQTGQ